MRFILHESALNGDDNVLSLIDRLVDRVADEVHRIELPDVDRLQSSRWYRDARPTRRKVMTTAVAVPPTASSPPGLHAKRLEVSNADEAAVADKLAHTPLTVLVENREADGILLDILVEELGSSQLRMLWVQGQQVTPPAMNIETAGGLGEMPQNINRAISDSANAGRPLRFFVLCDSDKRWPNDVDQSSSKSIKKLRTLCADESIPLHVLRKRNVENYIPDSVIKAERKNTQDPALSSGFDALLRLSSPQRDYFPLKSGLSDNELAQALAVGLYAPDQEQDLCLLKERLFPKRPRPYILLADRHRAEFTDTGLLARDGNGEIKALLNAISKEL